MIKISGRLDYQQSNSSFHRLTNNFGCTVTSRSLPIKPDSNTHDNWAIYNTIILIESAIGDVLKGFNERELLEGWIRNEEYTSLHCSYYYYFIPYSDTKSLFYQRGAITLWEITSETIETSKKWSKHTYKD